MYSMRMLCTGLLPLLSGLATHVWARAIVQPAQSARGTLEFRYAPNITRVTFNHPPLNLFDDDLSADLLDFMLSIQPASAASQQSPKVVVFDSADPEVFVSHVDLNAFLRPDGGIALFSKLNTIVTLLRNTTGTVFLSEINGLATGFGNEFLTQTDIRFAGPKARASQLENAAGVFPAGGGLQALSRLMNRAWALQYILSSTVVDPARGAQIGWYNEYHPDVSQLKKRVDSLAKRIALFPAGALDAAKAGIVELYPPQAVYDRDTQNILALAQQPAEQAFIRAVLKAGGNQTRGAFELGLPDTLLALYAEAAPMVGN